MFEYVTSRTENSGRFVIAKWTSQPNHHGKNNPKAKKVLVEYKGEKKLYECLKYFYVENNTIPYSTLKTLARNENFSKKHNIKIQYV
jgi:hypothetical protein